MPLCILAGYYGFNANILFTFKQSSELKNLSAYLTYPRARVRAPGAVCKCFGDLWAYLGRNSFLKGIVKYIWKWEIWKILCCFKIRI